MKLKTLIQILKHHTFTYRLIKKEAIKWAKHWSIDAKKPNLWITFFNITEADLK